MPRTQGQHVLWMIMNKSATHTILITIKMAAECFIIGLKHSD
ncbi:hypothetical protein HMPREF0454_02684 [Hafnia alvei ATCC 51873]|uniref:Uncharacterized protein n=1 Tax=Hafnia alvei ATCC 51873 TaxID=1002364 RepID=G9Y7Z8_HAFAL|nr:hypothetical protein HMPREF0454_02684 [Hafnia alvei ATCC 51873]